MPIVHQVFLSLGSNIAPERHLPLAVARLRQLGDVLAASRVWQSPPADGSEQSHYLNAAVLLATEATAEELYGCRLPEIETALGRLRDPGDRYAPRTIDIDISLFDRDVYVRDPHARRLIRIARPCGPATAPRPGTHATASSARSDLTPAAPRPFPRIHTGIDPSAVKIPDPDILVRPFVALPLAELAPSLIHPITGETLRTIAARLAAASRTMTLRPDVTDALRRLLS